MPDTRIKICGVTRPDDLLWLNTSGIDYVGFVFAENSKRQVTPQQVAAMLHPVRLQLRTVGVFMNQPLDWVAKVIAYTGLDIAQLHGDEPLADIATLPFPVVKRIHPLQWLKMPTALQAPSGNLLYWLLDPGAGTGETFLWNAHSVHQHDLSHCWLAGGLNATNVAAHIKMLHPGGVDVSSGVEKEQPGIKDQELVKQFITQVIGPDRN